MAGTAKLGLVLILVGSLLTGLALASFAVPSLLPFQLGTGVVEQTLPPYTDINDATFGGSSGGYVYPSTAAPGSYAGQSFTADQDFYITRAEFAMKVSVGNTTPVTFQAILYPVTGTVGVDAKPVLETPLATSESRIIQSAVFKRSWEGFDFPSGQQYGLRQGENYVIALVQGSELSPGENFTYRPVIMWWSTVPHEGEAFTQEPPAAIATYSYYDLGVQLYGEATSLPETQPPPSNQTTGQPSTTYQPSRSRLVSGVLLLAGAVLLAIGVVIYSRKE